MSDNTTLARDALEQVCSGTRLADVGDYYSPQFVDHDNPTSGATRRIAGTRARDTANAATAPGDAGVLGAGRLARDNAPRSPSRRPAGGSGSVRGCRRHTDLRGDWLRGGHSVSTSPAPAPRQLARTGGATRFVCRSLLDLDVRDWSGHERQRVQRHKPVNNR